MSLKVECHSQNGMSLKMEFHLKWNVTQNGMSQKIDCHIKWNVAQKECN